VSHDPSEIILFFILQQYNMRRKRKGQQENKKKAELNVIWNLHTQKFKK